MDIQTLYERHIKPLSIEDRVRVITLTAQDLAKESASQKHDIMELHGLGAEIWRDIDVEQYINELRDDWDRPQ